MSGTPGTMRRLRLVVPAMRWALVLIAMAACSEPDAPVESSEPVGIESSEVPDDLDGPDELEGPEQGVDLDEVDLDEMDRPALEAACFAGQSAACDRLGH